MSDFWPPCPIADGHIGNAVAESGGPANHRRRMLFAYLCLILPGGLFLLADSLRLRVRPRDWRTKGQGLLGICAILYAGLGLYELYAGGASRWTHLLNSAERMLTGVSVGVFISLCLAGWFKEFLARGGGQT